MVASVCAMTGSSSTTKPRDGTAAALSFLSCPTHDGIVGGNTTQHAATHNALTARVQGSAVLELRHRNSQQKNRAALTGPLRTAETDCPPVPVHDLL